MVCKKKFPTDLTRVTPAFEDDILLADASDAYKSKIASIEAIGDIVVPPVIGTSLVYGGHITVNAIDDTKIDISAGKAQFSDSYTDPTNPSVETVTWGDLIGVDLTYRPFAPVSFLGITRTGSVYQNFSALTPEQERDIVTLGLAYHPDQITVVTTSDFGNMARDIALIFADFMSGFGGRLIFSGDIVPNGANLKLDREAVSVFGLGVNRGVNLKAPNARNRPFKSDVLDFVVHSGSGVAIASVNVPTTKYDKGGLGVLEDVPEGYFTTPRIFYEISTDTVIFQYGQYIYDSLKKASLSWEQEDFKKNALVENVPLKTVLAINEGCTELNDPSCTKFIQIGIFGDRTFNKIDNFSRFAESIEILDGMSYQRPSITYVSTGGNIYLDLAAVHTINRNDISFATADMSINTVSGNFLDGSMVIGDGITIEGSANNNRNYEIATITATKITVDAAVMFARDDISFASLDDSINTVAGDFDTGAFAVGEKLRVVGSVSNDGIYTVATITATAITVSEALVDEVAGADIEITKTITDEVAGADVIMHTPGKGDIVYVFEQREFALDCTTGSGVNGRARVQLTQGSVNVPVQNYAYITKSGEAIQLNASTTFPSGQFGWVCDVLVPNAASMEAYGVYSSQRYSDNKTHNGRGALSYERENIRGKGASYESGVVPTITIKDLTPDKVGVSTSPGEVYQLHKSKIPALKSFVDGIFVINHPAEPWKHVTDIGEIQVDANGDTLNNRSFNFVFIGIQSSSNGINYSHLGLLLPTGSYSYTLLNQSLTDENNTAVTSVPTSIKKTAFLIARVTFKYKNGVWNNVVAEETATTFFDLRGTRLGSATGGAGTPSVTTFSDDVFEIFNSLDPTKFLKFLLADISTGQTRTITMADRDLNLDTPIFSSVQTDTITEKSTAGVAIEGVTHKDNDLTVPGNLYVNGDKVAVDSRISTSDYILAMNFSETSSVVTSGRSGIETDRGSGNPYVNMFFETNDDYRIGIYYTTVNYTGKTGSFNLNDEVKGLTSGATGYVVSDSGTALKLKVVKGTFVTAETIENQTVTGSATANGAPVVTDDTQAAATRENTPVNEGIAVWNSTAKRLDTDANLKWDGSELNVIGQANVDNVNINGNAITAADANGNITVKADGTGNVILDGYVKRGGSSAPAIKDNKITGTTPAAGSSSSYVTGIAAGKHVGAKILVSTSTGQQIPPNYGGTFDYTYFFLADGKLQINVTSGSSSVANRPFRAKFEDEQ